MKITYTVRPPADDHEFSALKQLLIRSFNIPPDRCDVYAKRVGQENFRAVFDGNLVVGGLAMISMGQCFGGRAVPMIGIAAVAIDPGSRGRGAGTALMQHTVHGMREQGAAISTLYPATQPIYRAAGYEQAGGRYEIILPLASVNMRETKLTMRPIGDEDHAAVEALYLENALQHNGTLDRPALIWQRVRETRAGDPTDGYLVEGGHGIEGYIYYTRVERAPFGYNLIATDFVATTPAAGRRMLTFFANHRSMGESLTFFRAPTDPLLSLLPEQSCAVHLDLQWMVRILDVEHALTARGYAPGRSAELHLDVHGDFISANNDRFILRVENGAAQVQRGGTGAISLEIKGLASLYAGYRTAEQLITSDLLSASADDAAQATSLFAGGAPWMVDQF